MPAAAITDVLPPGPSANVTGSITDPIFGTRLFSAASLSAPLGGARSYYSALADVPLFQNRTYLITFGTDTGLQTTVGWDNVTGLGTPNGQAFADYFNPARTVQPTDSPTGLDGQSGNAVAGSSSARQ
jgi:hypothetical protein